VPAQQQSEQHSELRPQQQKEDADESQQSRAEQARDAIRHDMATSPMGAAPRSLLSNDERHTYSIALSPHRPHGGCDRDAAGRPAHPSLDSHAHAAPSYDFTPAPHGVNPDSHLAQQAERLHRYSVKALKEQLLELRREERAIDKAQRTSEKAELVAQRKWDNAVVLSSVREGSCGDGGGGDQALDDSADDESAHARHAFALDDEQEAATQTDVTLALQHAWKPRVAARNKHKPLREPSTPTEKQRIEAEVAAEYAQKAAATFGTRAASSKTGVAATKPPGASTLPRFQSQADAYRAQLHEQYRVIFEAQVAATQQDPRAGELIEARLKKLRDDALFMGSHRAAATADAGGRASQRRTGQDGADVDEKKSAAGADSLPDTVIGSRTAALLFLDPQMMRRKQVVSHQVSSARAPLATASPMPVTRLHAALIRAQYNSLMWISLFFP